MVVFVYKTALRRPKGTRNAAKEKVKMLIKKLTIPIYSSERSEDEQDKYLRSPRILCRKVHFCAESRGIVITIVCLLSFLSANAHTGSQNDFLTVNEAMNIVSYHRYHPMANRDEFDNVIKSMVKSHGYMEKDFLGDGIGTCDFWQYVRGGHVIMKADKEFIPDDKQTASTVAVIDCEGVEDNGGDELAITIELSVFSERSWAVLMRQMQDIGFEYKTSIDDWNVYVWHTYEIKVQKMIRNGYDCWEFDFGLAKREYKTTRLVEYKDSTRSYDVSIILEFPVRGNPALLRQVRTFMIDAIEPSMTVDQIIPRYNGDLNDDKAIANYYGRKRCAFLDKDYYDNSPLPFAHCVEFTSIEVVGENDYYITFEVFRYGNCGGSSFYRVYGTTFRKSDGKRLRVIANPQDPKLRRFLNESLYIENRDALDDEYKNHIPMPEYDPYLIQDGVRFVYQQGEIAVRPAGFIKTESSYPLMRPFLTDEAKAVLK